MEFYQTVMGKRFFENQLPRLTAALSDIAAALNAPRPVLKLEQQVQPDFLKDIYYGEHDPSLPVDAAAASAYDADIIAHQAELRKAVTQDTWEIIERYRSLLDARGAVEREQAFASGFRYATSLFAAGLSAAQDKGHTS